MVEHNIWYVKQKLSRVGKLLEKVGCRGEMVIPAEGRRHGLKKVNDAGSGHLAHADSSRFPFCIAYYGGI